MATGTGHRAGRVLGGRYELGPVIGRGGMGQVHRAHDTRLHRDVAIKVLRLELSAPADRARFEREAMVAARISHPNVIAVYDVGEQDDELYIVMECLPGRTLADELASGPLPPDRARRIAFELLGALEAAHAQGVLHRDLKPGNVLFSRDGVAKLGDFGIAKLRDEADLTEAGLVIGTARYMAPERLRGEPASEASDVYAMGVLLYEAVTGCPPFAGDSPAAVAHAIAHTDALPVHLLRPQCDPQLAAVIHGAMVKDPASRFPSAGAMVAALAGAASTAVTPPHGTNAAARALAPTDAHPSPPILEAATATMAGAAAPWAAAAPTALAPTVAGGPTAIAPTAADDPPTDPPTFVRAGRRRGAGAARLLAALGLVLLLGVAGLLALAAARSRDEQPAAPTPTTAVDSPPTSTAPPVTAAPATTVAPAPPTSVAPTPTTAAPAPAPGPGKPRGKDKKG